jgi:putative drug exporter of the RND superfamily
VSHPREARTGAARLARAVAGHYTKWLGLVVWTALAVFAVPLAGRLADVQEEDAAAWLPRTAETTRALDRAEQAFPGADTLVAVVVYVRDGGLTTEDQTRISDDRAAFARLAEGGEVGPPAPSDDGAALIYSFPLAATDGQAEEAAINEIRDRLADGPPGLRAALTGSAGALGDIIDAFSGLDSTLIIVTAAVVAILLLITYRSPVLWLVPLMAVGVAAQLASALVYLLAKHAGVTVNPQSEGIMTVLVFGVGTDYALLLIARYREELRRHADRHEAMAIALRRSFPAILASAATVALGLLCLLAAQMNNVRGLGPVGAAGIVAAMVVMTGLLPILLVVCGRWLFWPFVPRYDAELASHDIAEDHAIWHRVAGLVGRRPRAVWVATAVGLAALCLGVLGLRLGLPASEAYTREVASVTGQRMVAAHYPGGAAAPAEVLTRTSAVESVAAVAAGVDGVAAVRPAERSADGRWARFQAVLADPPDSAEAKQTIDRLRVAVHAVPAADALVGGDTATQLDTERASEHDNRAVLPLILAVVLLVLTLLLRALVAPVLLVASVLLSFAAAMGAAGLIFRAVGYPTIGYDLPLFGFLFLVALGVDYTIFLMTRAREETATLGHRQGVLHALTVTGGVITSAGVVLAATFASLAVLPLVSGLQLGLLVAVGVLLDTLVVRTLLVPALALDVGRWAWWPSALARRRPERVSIRPPADGDSRVPERVDHAPP